MLFEFINFNSPPFVAVNCDNGKVMGKLQCHTTNLERLTKIITELGRKQLKK